MCCMGLGMRANGNVKVIPDHLYTTELERTSWRGNRKDSAFE